MRKERQVKLSYESNRLTERYVANAYEKIIPIIKHSRNFAEEKTEIPTLKTFQMREALK